MGLKDEVSPSLEFLVKEYKFRVQMQTITNINIYMPHVSHFTLKFEAS